MPRSSNQKIKLTAVRNILLENTNPSHPITVNEIIKELKAMGISAERKSIYNDMETLKMLGVDIQTVRNRTVGYYIDKREFDISELKLLIDSVRASKFIPEKQSTKLIEKLSSLACIHDRPSLNREVFVSDRAKKLNGDIFATLDIIHSAMESNVSIHFKYFQWTVEGQKEYRKNGEYYSVSPWSLVWDDSTYYLVGFDNDLGEIRHYRVDKMALAKTTLNQRLGKEEFKKYNITAYSGAVFGMFGGEMQRVTLSCANRLANIMLDRFGSDTPIIKDGDRFRIHANVVPSPVFLGWVLSFGREAEILAPKEVRENYLKLSGRTEKI